MDSTAARSALDDLLARHPHEAAMVASILNDLAITATALEPFSSQDKIVIFGSARITKSSPTYEAVRSLARRFAADGFVIVTGGGPGVMSAGLEGAGSGNALGIAIQLPFESPAGIAGVPVVMQQRFFTRKLALVRRGRGFVILPGGFGTLDETFEVLTLLQTGKKSPCPVVLYDPTNSGFFDPLCSLVSHAATGGFISPDDSSLYSLASTEDEVVGEVHSFWSNYESFALDGPHGSISTRRPVDPTHLAGLDVSFPQFAPFTLDPSKQRLSFRFERRNYGPLRRLINVVNSTL